MKRSVIGIDPGLDGGLALYDPIEGSLRTEDIPTLELKSKRLVDEYALARLIDEWASEVSEVWLELVSGMPSIPGKDGKRRSMGATSAFGFGRTYGAIRGICAANFLPICDVPPGQWKAALKVRGGKDESRLVASRIFPRFASQWPLRKHHNRAEAALIALYGTRTANHLISPVHEEAAEAK